MSMYKIFPLNSDNVRFCPLLSVKYGSCNVKPVSRVSRLAYVTTHAESISWPHDQETISKDIIERESLIK